jgi:ketosteroid isomerase-like protein
VSFRIGCCGAASLCTGRKDQSPKELSRNRHQSRKLRVFQEYVGGDIEAIRNLYTDDAVILPPGQKIRGNSKIAGYFAPRPNRVNISHSMVSSDLKIRGDIAVDIGMWNNTWKVGEAEAESASGQYLVIWKCGADGQWRIEYDMWHRPNE